jgi:maltooligosyltrehalose trehalohydrolase
MFGERIGQLAPSEAVRAAAEIYLPAPQIPMLFMGEEWGSKTPFPFFCDFAPDLALLVARGRREEFSEFFDPEDDGRIPDPGAEETFRRAVLHWASLDEPEHTGRLKLYGELLALRRGKIVPRLAGIPGDVAAYQIVDDRGPSVQWTLGDGSTLALLANLGPEPLDDPEWPPGERLSASEDVTGHRQDLPGWSVLWHLAE